LVGPGGELVAIRQSELAEHRRHVRLDRLDRQVQALRDLAVRVATGEQAEHLLLAVVLLSLAVMLRRSVDLVDADRIDVVDGDQPADADR
jgi:hypothetical protein